MRWRGFCNNTGGIESNTTWYYIYCWELEDSEELSVGAFGWLSAGVYVDFQAEGGCKALFIPIVSNGNNYFIEKGE